MKLHGCEIDDFVRAYIECALWSSTDNSIEPGGDSHPDSNGGDPLDKYHSAEDLVPETLDAMIADCDRFRAENPVDLELVIGSRPRHHRTGAGRGSTEYTRSDAGHDFWLSRNGHGAGFFDQDPDDEPRAGAWDRLQAAAGSFGEVDLFVSEGSIHHG